MRGRVAFTPVLSETGMVRACYWSKVKRTLEMYGRRWRHCVSHTGSGRYPVSVHLHSSFPFRENVSRIRVFSRVVPRAIPRLCKETGFFYFNFWRDKDA